MDSDVAIPSGTIVLDKYQVVRTLGVGGMGIVVEAMHTALGTPVAIKFLLPHFASSQEAGRRFVREAKAASKIASEHVVRVFDAGTSQPYGPYIVMEFLAGHDLSRHVRKSGAFPIETAIDFVVQAAAALAEAHAAGIVHRDVKPANLFLVEQPDGAQLLKVLDFGISKVVEETSLEVTKTSAILGSGLYMSPEQMKSSKSVDHRTDVYALGVTLFELLTCTQPYTADSFAELAIKVNMEAPTDIRNYRADVSPELAAVIARAYAKKPEERYQSMGELALALLPWAAPRTRPTIEALARTETRRGRAPSIHPVAEQGAPRDERSVAVFGDDLRFPPPPSLPTPSSLGLDTFGLSNKKVSADSLGQTSEKSFVAAKKHRSSASIVGVGVAVGVIGAGAAAFFMFAREPGTPEAPLASPPSASAFALASSSSPSADVRVSPAESVASAPISATSSARAQRSVASAPAVKSAAPPTSPTVWTASPPDTAAVHEPPPTFTGTATSGAPCKIRNLDGTLRDCPTK